MVADGIRMGIKKELSQMAMVGASEASRMDESPSSVSTERGMWSKEWQLLDDPSWRPGAQLGMRSPYDSPCMEELGQMQVQVSQPAIADSSSMPYSGASR